MTRGRVMRWWPPVGVLAMLLLGWAVREGPTWVDGWVQRHGHRLLGSYLSWLLVLTDWTLLGPLLALSVLAAVYRHRWRLAVVVAVCPFAAIAIAEALKRIFGRYKGGALAYPSGHMTLLVVVVGMAVLVAGARLWVCGVASVVGLLGLIGLACTYHYLTDTIGAVLLGTALVCIAVQIAEPLPHAGAQQQPQ